MIIFRAGGGAREKERGEMDFGRRVCLRVGFFFVRTFVTFVSHDECLTCYSSCSIIAKKKKRILSFLSSRGRGRGPGRGLIDQRNMIEFFCPACLGQVS